LIVESQELTDAPDRRAEPAGRDVGPGHQRLERPDQPRVGGVERARRVSHVGRRLDQRGQRDLDRIDGAARRGATRGSRPAGATTASPAGAGPIPGGRDAARGRPCDRHRPSAGDLEGRPAPSTARSP
jgi:hypothetical protein